MIPARWLLGMLVPLFLTTGGGSESDAPGSHGALKIDHEAQERIGLRITKARAARLQPEIKALGILEEDPAGSFTLRAPVTGYLRATDGEWPAVGALLADAATVGIVQPRLTALEQFDRTAQLMEAQAAVAEQEAELEAARASFESKRKLNAEGKMVSDRLYEEAEAKVKISEARLAGAQRKLALLEKERATAATGLEPFPLSVVRGGQVVEVLANPDEAVESGQPLLRVARFERLIARIELPVGQTWEPSTAPVRIAVSGDEEQVLEATCMGPAPRAGARTRGQSWLLAVHQAARPVRPGTPVTAFLPGPGPALVGVVLPRSALVRYGGKTWAFLRLADEEFERRGVELYSPTPDGWFVAVGVAPDEPIVEVGAQVLLSEQLKVQIERETEAEE